MSGIDAELLAAAPAAADAATVLTVLPPTHPPPLPLSALVSPFGRLLEELLVSEVSRLSMERGRWKTGSGAITTSGSFSHTLVRRINMNRGRVVPGYEKRSHYAQPAAIRLSYQQLTRVLKHPRYLGCFPASIGRNLPYRPLQRDTHTDCHASRL